MDTSHTFALYSTALPDESQSLQPGDVLELSDQSLQQRIEQVLRLRPGEALTLFDNHCAVQGTLRARTKRGVIALEIISSALHNSPTPAIHLMIGLLKKPAFEEIVYAATQMGIAEIVPIITTKVQRDWGGDKERQRLQAIMIAAAEQSKQFVLPTIADPVLIESINFDAFAHTFGFLADPDGTPLFDVINRARQQRPATVLVAIGPEGGFTTAETVIFQHAGFYCTRLTPAILRSTEAVTLLTGAIRSML